MVREVPELGLTRNTPLYTACSKDPDRFLFLNDPVAFMELIWSGLEIVGEVDVAEE